MTKILPDDQRSIEGRSQQPRTTKGASWGWAWALRGVSFAGVGGSSGALKDVGREALHEKRMTAVDDPKGSVNHLARSRWLRPEMAQSGSSEPRVHFRIWPKASFKVQTSDVCFSGQSRIASHVALPILAFDVARLQRNVTGKHRTGGLGLLTRKPSDELADSSRPPCPQMGYLLLGFHPQ